MEWKVLSEFKRSYEVTSKMVEDFAEASFDKNPIHLSDSYASSTQFKRRIAHGMLFGSLISAIIGNDFPGNGTIYLNQYLSFRKPVFLGDIVEIVVKITDIDEKGWLTLETNCYTDGNAVIEGNALVIPPK